MPCPARKANGETCGKNGTYYQGHCGVHHNSKLRSDPAYRADYEAYVANAQQRREQELALVTQRTAEREAARLARQQAEQAADAERRAAERVAKIRKNENSLNNAHLASAALVVSVCKKIGVLWADHNIPGYDIVKAYVALKCMPLNNPGFPALMRAVIVLMLLGFGNHPDHATYATVPTAEKEAALAGIAAALEPYGEIDIDRHLVTSDSLYPQLILRRQREEAERRAAIAREAERRRREQLQIDLRERPVVFQRDPEGGINLAAFATDNQNIHRSSVQNATHKMVLAILTRPVDEGQETLVELITSFQDPTPVRWIGRDTRERTITEVTNDYYNTEAFSVMYGDVLDRVWTYIRAHEHRNDLIIRLAQELCEGIGMCSNGKMARLMNVLQGYDETLEQEAPKELFQGRIALLTKLPLAEREAAARALFAEFHIPDQEHAVWLEPLLEA
jgi:hypothetical protein